MSIRLEKTRAARVLAAVAAASLVLSAPAWGDFAGGTYTDWTLPGNGYEDFTWHVQPLHDASPAPYFYANQFGFTGGNGGYLGLQTTAATRPDGRNGKIAIFAIWDTAESSPAPGGVCTQFYNEGVGSTCRIALDWVAGHDYRLRVARTGVSTWEGWVKEVGTDAPESKVGSITTPPLRGLLSGVDFTWSEYWGGAVSTCAALPSSRVRFHALSANGGTVRPTSHYNHIATGPTTCTNSAVTDVDGGVVQQMGDPPPPPMPGAVSGPATSVSETGAVLHATVDPRGNPTSYRFEYGTSSAYETLLPWASTQSDWDPVDVSATLNGLAPGTTYHFRVVVYSAAGYDGSPDRTFTTAGTAVPPPKPPGGESPGETPPNEQPPSDKPEPGGTPPDGPGAGEAGESAAPPRTDASPDAHRAETPAPEPPPRVLDAVVVRRLHVTPRAFAAAGRAAGSGSRRGATISFRSSAAATVTVAIARCEPAHGRDGRCARYRDVGSLERFAAAGRNALRFTGWVGRRRLPPGSYRVAIRAGPELTARSPRPAAARFRILSARGPARPRAARPRAPRSTAPPPARSSAARRRSGR